MEARVDCHNFDDTFNMKVAIPIFTYVTLRYITLEREIGGQFLIALVYSQFESQALPRSSASSVGRPISLSR